MADRADKLDLSAIAENVARLLGIAQRMHVLNTERDHEAKDEIVKGLAAVKRQLGGK